MGENKPAEIVDTHMHLWSPQTHPWIEKVCKGGHPAGKFVDTYLLEDYLKDIEGYNVTHTVHVEAAWPGDPVGETRWMDEIADNNKKGFPHGIAGYCDIYKEEAEDILSRHLQSKRFRSVRQTLNFQDNKAIYPDAVDIDYLNDPQWLKGLSLLEKFELSFEMLIPLPKMTRAAEVTCQFPRVRFMINHCGLPYGRDMDTMKTWREGLTKLARQPNVHCKVSGMFSTEKHWTQKSVADVVQPVLDIFGMDRCVFASNFPVDRINGTFPQLITVLSNILQPYTEDEKHKFFSGNGRKFYQL